jgi:hypothetical protein
VGRRGLESRILLHRYVATRTHTNQDLIYFAISISYPQNALRLVAVTSASFVSMCRHVPRTKDQGSVLQVLLHMLQVGACIQMGIRKLVVALTFQNPPALCSH